ncbi:MAG TPA: MBL fold metallo-hydrolase [Candidatus Hydrogenedentes bacterium]|nr:MBL fold metallo-hydrolase [Candidatus Hydrogenedentota bacterium]
MGEPGVAWRYAGVPLSEEETRSRCAALIACRDPVELAPHIATTGEISRDTAYETIPARFFYEANGERLPDAFPDDQALVLHTGSGIVLVLGCAHAGVVNTMRHVARVTGADSFRAVLGGMHLGGASEERMAKTIEAFRDFRVERIGAAHCTGEAATQAFGDAFEGWCFGCSAGTVLEFPR